eukprot:g2772.t1
MCSEVPHQWEGLEIERERLKNAVFHLKRTNGELEEILKEEGHDPELRQAIGENIVIIAKYLGEIERLDQEIRKARGEIVNITSSQKAAIPVMEPAEQVQS